MKSLIKKTFAAVVILAAIVDWPVKVEAGCGQVVAKEAVPLLRGCAGKVGKVTVDSEKFVNRSTQMMEKYGNKTLQNKKRAEWYAKGINACQFDNLPSLPW